MTTPAKLPRVTAAVATLAIIAAAATPAFAAGANTSLVSQSGDGVKGNGESIEPSISKTGRFIAFNSDANNLVPGDTNGVADCFVRDMVDRTIERINVASGGGQSNSYCFGPAISQDGRFVAFESTGSNLGVPTNGSPQIYLHDRQTNTTTLVSERIAGGQGGNDESADPAISGDGRYVVYESKASNLVDDDTNGRWDVFLYDRVTGETSRVSVRSNGRQANKASRDPDISANGKIIVFESKATNLVNKDRNKREDIFFHNRITGKTKLVSVSSRERQANANSGNPTVNGDGRFIAFQSQASNLVSADRSGDYDVFLRDRKKGKTVQISLKSNGAQAVGASLDPTISNSGRYIAFESTAKNLSKKDKDNKLDSYVRDRIKKKTRLMTMKDNGRPSYGDSSDPAISGDARYVTFESTARGIVSKDSDKEFDVFRRGPIR